MKIVLVSAGAKVPTRAENGAAGYDLYVPKDVTVSTGRNLIPLDIQIELNPGTEGFIRPRSGFSLNGIEGFPTGGSKEPQRYDADVLPGTIDESYRGIVGVIIKSIESKPFIIKAGTRIAQMVISSYCNDVFEITEQLSITERGEQGFGHTGTV